MNDVNDLFILNDLSIDREANKKKVATIPDTKWTVDNRGVVLTSRGKQAGCDISWDGSYRVNVTNLKGRQQWMYVNDLVLRAFVGEPPSNRYVPWHRDGDRSNNRADNLSWVVLSGDV